MKGQALASRFSLTHLISALSLFAGVSGTHHIHIDVGFIFAPAPCRSTENSTGEPTVPGNTAYTRDVLSASITACGSGQIIITGWRANQFTVQLYATEHERG